MQVLILGGTTEASQLVRTLAGDKRFQITLSLAGRTAAPATHPVRCRVGGFGGADALADWLVAERVGAVIDATHPFAARISANAVAAAQRAQVPMLTLSRPPWQRLPADRWTCVADVEAATRALGDAPKRIFLTIGRQEIKAFRAAPQHTYVIRSIDPPDADTLPPATEIILQRGPFEEHTEIALMQSRSIDMVVAKNSGGDATYAKIAAARELALPVVMIDRPIKPCSTVVSDPGDACAWLVSLLHDHPGTASERGV